MTALVPSRSRRGPSNSGNMSLFPFLAVLLCTMGALIVLLVIIAHRARQHATYAVAAKIRQRQVERQTALEDVQWRIEQLRQSRTTTEDQVADLRLEVGHLEDHARRLEQRLGQLREARSRLHERSADDTREDREREADLIRARTRLEVAREALEEAKRMADERPPAYAVVPYAGPNETRQRPLYLECRENAVVLQPEEIVLRPDDFEGPMGPGNPLAAALRAAREHLIAQPEFDPEPAGEPYPLILVRPDGVAAYYAVRAAMASWGSEFGYELVGEDWRLDFPPRDAQLAVVVRDAVETARARQTALAAAAPRHYDAPRPRYRVAPTYGGVIRDDVAPEETAGDYHSATPAGSFARRFGGERREASEAPPSSPKEQGAGFAPDAPTPRPGEWHVQPASQRPSAPAVDRERPQTSVRSLAEKRGDGWGLPKGARGSVPVARDIRVACHPDRLVLVPERGLRGRKEIPLDGPTIDALDAFVSAVWKYMDSWGIAGHGMYWRPTLRVRVAPGAEPRFRDLRTLLEDSGMKVKEG